MLHLKFQRDLIFMGVPEVAAVVPDVFSACAAVVAVAAVPVFRDAAVCVVLHPDVPHPVVRLDYSPVFP